MSFNYHKNKEGSQDSFWTSYSDLFLGLSTIFLLLYVVSSLRTGTDSLRGQVENEKLTMQVQELQNQLRMYESVKNDYMENQAPKDEQQEYQELMDKLTLLQEDAKDEKERLIQDALENEKKAKALNKYQQMVRNVLNANKMAKSKIVNRDDLIKDQDVEIEAKENEIGDLQKDINSKKQLIAQNEKKIEESEQALQKNMNQLQFALKKNQITKKAYEQRVAKLRADAEAKIQGLADVNAKYSEQLSQANAELNQAQAQIGQMNEELDKTTNQLGRTTAALGAAKSKLGNLNAELGQTRGLLAQKEGEAMGLKGKLNAVAEELGSAKNQLGQAKGMLAQKEGEAAGLRGKLQATEGQLAQAKAELEARKSVADDIKKGFAKAGIKAEIDGETGDVVLDFGQAYFDSDSAKLKSEMKKVLEKAMPIYSQSLFGNPKVRNKISAVEIIGFASPTYQGRFIDPKSNKPEDKEAMKYNMDLSYRRANAIFGYVLDQGNVSYEHQRELMGLMKVSGRSFLEVMKVNTRNVATAADFCKQNDCKKAQRVIVRFSMDQKK